ncbi:MAG TPA: response regulator [Candidatus Sulfotelmatobacter sp.]|nr:response regulator [Candidatus Sulfotelmatobacter sp.]HWI57623.1 response regulator [Bacillota bacterium]
MQQDPAREKTVLVVDDQATVRQAIRLLLSIDHHTVTEAIDGAEALALFTENQFDLVITDFEMPVMKGNELATKIKQLAPSQPILMITAYGNRLGSSDNPVDAILAKPFRFDELRTAIATLLSPRQREPLVIANQSTGSFTS